MSPDLSCLNVGLTQMMSQQEFIVRLLCCFTMYLRTHQCRQPPAGPVGVAAKKQNILTLTLAGLRTFQTLKP